MTSRFVSRSAGLMALGLGALFAGAAAADQVIVEDLIVKGRTCLGIPCVNAEPFNAATVQLKSNSVRLDLLDMSVGASPPYRDWRIEANSATVGGPAYLAFKDMGDNATGVEGAGVPIFQIRAAAPANSLFISSAGYIGVGTSVPAKDVHILDGSTPTLRFQQDASEKRPVRTWDIGGNELGFFVNDVLPASTNIPFGIVAGAPTGSFVIGPSGFVGIGVVPQAKFHTVGGVRFAGLPNCASGIRTSNIGILSCITSSRRFKNVAGDLSEEVALANVMALRPKVGSYKETPQEPEHWLIAEEAADVDPAFVGLQDGAPFTVKTQNIVADLVTVIQRQQKLIEAQEKRLAALEEAIAAR